MPVNLDVNLSAVRARIAAAAELAGRAANDITLVAVSKTQNANALRDAIAAGTNVFGENKVQEADEKIQALGRNSATWHFIGHLQANKARRAARIFDVIESVDSLELAQRLERICIEEDRAALSVFVEVDLAGEATKSGVSESDLTTVADFLRGCMRLRFDGLMLIPPFFDDADKARPFFRRLREIRDELRSRSVFANGRGELSMGMSHDFEIAIAEGATVVRIGTAIFGERR